MSDNSTTPFPSQPGGYPFFPSHDFGEVAKRQSSRYFDRFEIERDVMNNIVLLSGTVVHPYGTSDYRLHCHQRYELILPQSQYRCHVNYTPLTIHRGQALIIQPGDTHQDHLASNEPYYAFEFTSLTQDLRLQIPRIFVKGIMPERQIVDISDVEMCMQLLDMFWKEAKEHEGGRHEILGAFFSGILWECIDSYDKSVLDLRSATNTLDEALLQKILAVFKKDIALMPDVPRFCRELSMSPSALSRACHTFFKMPPGRAFMNYKINTAKQMMAENPRKSLREISEALGFLDQFHFSKNFKHITGGAPSNYLKQLR